MQLTVPENVTPSPPAAPSIQTPPAASAREWRLEDLLRHRATYALALVIALLLLSFGESDRREHAANYVQHSLKDPVAAISPFSIIDVFFDSARGCSFDSFSCEPKSTWAMVPRFPQASLDTAQHILEQGLIGVVIIGIPFVVLLVGLIASTKEEGNWLMMLHPGYWVMFLLFVALAGWSIQLVLLLALFVVKQTILACGVLAVLYVVYERWELGGKLANLVMGALGKRVQPVL